LSLAAEQYCLASGGYYPIAYYSDFRAPLATQYNWDFTTAKNLSTGQITVTPGLIWPGYRVAPVQQCPAYDGSSNTAADPYTGYNYNSSYIGGGQSGSVTLAPAKASQIRHPARCALFGDGQYYSGADKFMRSPFPGPADLFFGNFAASAGTQGFRHHGRTNVVFCDGHAETLGDCFTQETTLDRGTPGKGTGFLSADNGMYALQ
jgi:prepilin-type processing-associated H-X9-DG protein